MRALSSANEFRGAYNDSPRGAVMYGLLIGTIVVGAVVAVVGWWGALAVAVMFNV